jgi:hypothetical protein
VGLLAVSGFAAGLLAKIGGKKQEEDEPLQFNANVTGSTNTGSNAFAPPSAVESSALDLSAFNQSTPPPITVRVQIGNEDVGEYLNQYITVQNQITG